MKEIELPKLSKIDHLKKAGILFSIVFLLFMTTACEGTPEPLPTTTFQFNNSQPTVEGTTPRPESAVSPTPNSKELLATARASGQILPPEPLPETTPAPYTPLPPPALDPLTMLARTADPVVIRGENLPTFLGIEPNELVAWRWDGQNWQQIPLQIDERQTIDLRVINGRQDASAPVFTFYADPAINPDVDPTLDADDEIVFMARDIGVRLQSESVPEGVLPSSGLEIIINDPAATDSVGYIYLFRQDGSLDPAAGQQYVVYDYNPLPFEEEVEEDKEEGVSQVILAGENSTIVTAHYGQHFSAAWIINDLQLFPTGAGNLIDRFRIQLTSGDCDRSEFTFSAGRTYFVAQKSGPVRAIRSYMGANSGVYTQRLHLFYGQRQDIITYVRVHAVRGLMDFIDYGPNAIGMNYANNLNPDGVEIDGHPDDILTGELTWELISGTQGSLIMLHHIETTIPNLTAQSYYLDSAEPEQPPCTGDDQALGQSGIQLRSLPCTDPARAVIDEANCPIPYLLILNRVIYFEEPGQTAETADFRYQQWMQPLQAMPQPAG